MKWITNRLVWMSVLLAGSALACSLPALPSIGPAQPVALASATQTSAARLPAVTATHVSPTEASALPSVTPAPPTPAPPVASPTQTEAPQPTRPAIPPTPNGQQLARPNGSAVATRLYIPPVVDGDFSEWKLGMFAVNAVTFGSQNWSGVEDLSGSIMLGWDDANLYLAVHVVDDVYVQNTTGHHIYEGDSVEILLDTNLAGDYYTNSLSPDDYQLGMSPGLLSAGNNPEAFLWYPEAFEGYRPEVLIAARDTDIGYDLEAAIPWGVFSVAPQPWSHYGFAFSISDNDKVDDILQQSLASNISTRRLTQPTTWGDLMLGYE